MAVVEMMQVADAIRGFRFRFTTEDQLQEAIACALAERGIDALREVRLGSRDRIDLLVGAVGIEVKVEGSLAEVRRQLERYARHDAIEALILVTSRAAHGLLGAGGFQPNDKPFEFVNVGRGVRA